jgi:hypothetical protein
MSRVAAESIGHRVVTRACGLCGNRVTSAVFDRTGLRTGIEAAPPVNGDGRRRLAILAELPGIGTGGAVRVVVSLYGRWQEHFCPKARGSFSAANFNRKRRDP